MIFCRIPHFPFNIGKHSQRVNQKLRNGGEDGSSSKKYAPAKIVFDKMVLMYRLVEVFHTFTLYELKESTMFTVSEKAVEMIKEFLKDKGEEHTIRLMMNEGG